MWTYRDAGLDFAGETWPAGATEAAGDKTTWNYDAATGWLTSKVDAAGNATVYTYYPDGKLESRRWARTQGAGLHPITLYTYYPTGELQKVDYRLGTDPASTVDDPGTVDVEYTYDALGRVATVTDAVGTRTMVYDPDTLQLIDEVIDGTGDFNGVYDVTLHRKYEGDPGVPNDVPGRAAGLQIDDGSNYDVTYGYESGTGRFQRVAWNVDGQTDEAVYGYVANSDLLSGMATTSGQTTTYGWEPHRDLRTSIVNAFDAGAGSDVVSRFDYRYDAVGRRTDVVTTGSAFGGAGNEELSLWAYNDRNEVVGSSRHAGSDPDAPGAVVPAEARSYQFDPIGNRTSALDQDGATSISYASNSVNQYDNVDGIALSHDLDGNMLGDGSGMTLGYNGENRLVQAERGQEFTSTFVYDYLGRRVLKEVDSDDDGVWDHRTYFVYDGWNVIRELREGNGGVTTAKRHVWGLDLSGSIQGAGGVGGLLAAIDGAGQDVFMFDGNGNVSDVLATSDGSPQAHYEYDAFGTAVVLAGPEAEENPWRFSTTPVDGASGLSYYGQRYFLLSLGRWNRRDPIGEVGGLNLAGYAGNDMINTIDVLGHGLFYDMFSYVSPTRGHIRYEASLGNLFPGKLGRKVKGLFSDIGFIVDMKETSYQGTKQCVEVKFQPFVSPLFIKKALQKSAKKAAKRAGKGWVSDFIGQIDADVKLKGEWTFVDCKCWPVNRTKVKDGRFSIEATLGPAMDAFGRSRNNGRPFHPSVHRPIAAGRFEINADAVIQSYGTGKSEFGAKIGMEAGIQLGYKLPPLGSLVYEGTFTSAATYIFYPFERARLDKWEVEGR